MQRLAKDTGFTLIEVVVAAVIIGILAAIAAPSWLSILTHQRLYNARANALAKIREAQSQAIRTARSWEVCFRDRNGFVEVSVQPASSERGRNINNCRNHTAWQPLMNSAADARLVAIKTNETPGPRTSLNGNRTNGYSIRFGSRGERMGGTGAVSSWIVFTPRDNPQGPYYCVYAESIIGQFREGKIPAGQTACR